MNKALIRFGGWSTLLAGLFFFITVVYLFTVLPAAGWDIDMFDEPTRLLPWVADNTPLYRGLWVLYFLTQAFLLSAPIAVREAHKESDETTRALLTIGAVLGIVSITMAIVGLVTFYASAPLVAEAYASVPVGQQPIIVLLHNLTADLGKELRLFSELLLGIWLLFSGRAWRRSGPGWFAWLLILIGGYTFIVAAIKIANPLSPLEDFLGFMLAITYVLLGLQLLKMKPDEPAM